ncbi:MAG: DUF6768 family protein [Planctomycetota bacterium]
MSHVDKKLSAALSDDEHRLLEEMPDYDNIFTLMSRSFKSAMRPFVILLFVMSLVAMAFFVFSVWKVFESDTTQSQILWSMAATGTYIWIGLAKVWYWMQMERQKLLMELKRAELRVLSAIEARNA